MGVMVFICEVAMDPVRLRVADRAVEKVGA
jgi:hypothetical protein